jgi:hypothetical protein
MTTRQEAAVQALAMLRDMGVTMTRSRPVEGDDFCAKYLRLVAHRDRHWFRSRLRARTPDRDRIDVKLQRSARAVRLFAFWWFGTRKDGRP